MTESETSDEPGEVTWRNTTGVQREEFDETEQLARIEELTGDSLKIADEIRSSQSDN